MATGTLIDLKPNVTDADAATVCGESEDMFLCTKAYYLAVQVHANTFANSAMDAYDVIIYQTNAAAIGAIITVKITYNV